MRNKSNLENPRLKHKSTRFSSVRFFEVPRGWTPDPEKLKSKLFVPTGPTEEVSWGFQAPRLGDEPGNYPLVEVINGVHVVRHRTQTRSVPKSAIDQGVDEACRRIETETGRKPGKKERKALRDDVSLSLLPRAFTKDSVLWGMAFPDLGLLVISSASTNASARLCSSLVDVHTVASANLAPGQEENFRVRDVRTQTSAEKFMLHALVTPDDVAPFGPATSCVLVSQDESRRQVTYKNHQLQGNEELDRHLKMGHMPTKLGLVLESDTYFEMDTSLGLTKVQFSDDLFKGNAAAGDSHADAFDADVVLISAGIRNLYLQLTSCMGVERLDDTSLIA